MPPTEDHYATLGVPPRSEASAIRAAYLDLMRRFHPDRNSSPEAVERSHAITAAFAVLGNVEKRLHYDWARRRAADEAAASQRRWAFRAPKVPIAAVLTAMVLLPLSYIAFSGSDPEPRVVPPTKVAAKRQLAPPTNVAPAPAEAELPLPVPEPAAVAEPEPLELAVAPEPVAKVPEATPPAAPPAASPPKPLPRPEPRLASSKAKPQPPAAPPANPRCRSVNPGAESAICNSDNLTALDRSVVTFYNQSLKFGAPAKRGPLLDARIAFLLKREECKTDACLQSLHLAHLREMSAIVEKKEQP